MANPDLVSTIIGIASTIIGLVIVVGGGYYAFRGIGSRSLKDNQKELIDVLMLGKEEQKVEMKELQKKHQQSQQDIANLQGQVDTLKTVPLRVIGEEMLEIKSGQNKLLESTNAILEHLKGNNQPKREP